MKHRILLVDDEPDILEFMSYNLIKAGYEVQTASNGGEAVEKALRMHPHLVILDVMMPGMGGYETCRALRACEELSHTLIAFLTARGEDESQIEGFEAGGDDYIPKPIRMQVLMSRIGALLKRHQQPARQKTDSGTRSVEIDLDRRLVIRDGVRMTMPRKEFALLVLLHAHPGKVFSREEIFAEVWDRNVIVGDRTIDVHIRKLREKIGEEHIVTLKGVGYKYED